MADTVRMTTRPTVHTLWKVRGGGNRAVTAQISTDPVTRGWELKITYEPNGRLEGSIDRVDVSPLLDQLLESLLGDGWKEQPCEAPPPPAHRVWDPVTRHWYEPRPAHSAHRP